MVFDSHAHLDDKAFSGDLEQVVERARKAGVTGILTVGTDAESSQKACEIAEAHEGVLASVGIHPHEADSAQSVDPIRPLLGRAVALGETGLDYARDYSKPGNQKALFLEHMKLAGETGLPLVVHCRDAHPDCREMLRRHMKTPIRGVMHCFSGGPEDLRDYLDMGLLVSIAGPVTFPNARQLREVAAMVPLDRLLVETDSPYLAPQKFRGKRNEPAYVVETARALADIFQVGVEKMAEAVSCNATGLFRS